MQLVTFRIKFIFSLGTLVDILSIVPAILEAIDPQMINYFTVIRILRLMRLLRGYRIFNLDIDGEGS